MDLGKQIANKRRVFEVAKELKVVTPTIIEFLEAKGYDVSRKQMHPVTEEMYVALLNKFDKAKFAQYQSEHSTTREAVQKRDYARLRKEEQQQLLAVKETKETPKEKASKKIELPKFSKFIVEGAPPEPEETTVKTDDDKDHETAEKDSKEPKEPAKTVAETKETDAVEVTKKRARKTKKKKVERSVEDVKSAPERSAKVEPIDLQVDEKAIDSTETEVAESVPHKIELPKGKSLKIVAEAPKKEKPKPEKTAKSKQKPKPKKKPEKVVEEEVIDTTSLAKALEKVEGKGDSTDKPSKRKLRRKRLKIKPETVEDALESEQEKKLAKDIEKQGKLKSGTAKADTPTKPSRKRRRKKKTKAGDGAQPTSKPSGRSRKRQKVSATEVAATIKETMAKVEGRDKSRRRHTHSKEQVEVVDENAPLKVQEFITTQELSSLMDISFQEIIQCCLGMGMIVSINQRLDKDTIELLAAEFGFEVEFGVDELVEEIVEDENSENLEKRPPVVTIMGHVDHGKTTLLDYLRRTSVADSEVGGITQHIGAYEVTYNDEKIAFLDTPGHEAFTAMRARGAQITDIVVLVVAADDRVMPQTLEAIDHARAANTPIIVAINKIDKPEADPERLYKELADNNILVEKWGGKYQSTEISAKFGQGTDDLLAEILVAADMLELKADPTVRSRGVVVESRLDKGLGGVATILVQTGTLTPGNAIVVGENYGRVRSLFNERGEKKTEAGPSTPVQVVGFNGIPQAGDQMLVYPTEKEAREVSLRRQRQHRELSARKISSLTLEQASRRLQEASLKELPLLIKGDVHGSIEVLSDSLMRLSTEEVKVEIIHRGVGGINESDALLAAASGAVIIGFHVHPNLKARELARKEGLEIRLYRIIHEVVDDIRATLEGMLAPLQEEKVDGRLTVRQVFKVSRLGTIAGSYVLEGKIRRNSKVRLIRDDIEIWTGNLASLKRFKDDAKEVVSGFECGVALEGHRDVRIEDIIEVFSIVETKRTLDESA